ncbi:enhancer of split M1 protein-like [Haematobia irritans]|uniref:enhancer of split M1 protein-like n=1 Tax=Haematobia irritans TaxID=7368 RepID=UPI003F504905
MASMKWIFTLTIIAIFALINFPNTAEAQNRAGCPEFCPEIYSPVCATFPNGQRKQFSNSCDMNRAVCQTKKRITSSVNGEC